MVTFGYKQHNVYIFAVNLVLLPKGRNNNNNSLFRTVVHMHNKNIIIKNTYIQLLNKYITVKK